MRSLGFFLLLAGWMLVVATMVLLGSPTPRTVFILAGMAVEVIGFVLIARSHLLLHGGE